MKIPSVSRNSHSVAASSNPSLRQRKQPLQARSEATVAALLEASIQVLLAVGYRRLTTTRVAERAGVSVGTLYQYFPNRQALIAAVLRQYLGELEALVTEGCTRLHGQGLEALAAGLVEVVVAAKWRRIEVTRALHEPLVDIRAADLVRATGLKVAGEVAGCLRQCSDARFRNPELLAVFIVTACISLLQAAVADPQAAMDPAVLKAHLRAMVLGYLRESQQPPAPRL
jgi:AcrR family transcriptional regulator